MSKKPDGLRGITWLMARLRTSHPAASEWLRDNDVPVTLVSGRPKFRESDVEAAIERSRLPDPVDVED